jgi:hypothetical protein
MKSYADLRIEEDRQTWDDYAAAEDDYLTPDDDEEEAEEEEKEEPVTPELLAELYAEDHDECEYAKEAFLAGYAAALKEIKG